MKTSDADTLVIFGATGDLCARKIFPALYNLVRHGHLAVPVVGVARAGWTLEKFVAYVKESVQKAEKNPDAAVIERLGALLK
jgi:glucose-6-phosphate 1-dehydrogenase